MSKSSYWKTHHEAWAQSGLTQAEYCRENKLHPVTFSYWKRQLQERKEKSSGFIAVRIPETTNCSKNSSSQDSLQIELPDGLKLAFSMQANPAQIAEIVGALRKS